jgi:ATP-dependent Clp protease ATP-binding subunit ClpA
MAEMPKINVYLPDDLAAAVRAAGFAVSPVCQHALADAVRAVATARKTSAALRNPDFDPGRLPQIGSRIESRMTPRLHEAVRLARGAAGPQGRIETGHLLVGILEEGENLASRLLEGLGVDLDDLLRSAMRGGVDEVDAASTGTDGSLWTGLTLAARMAIAAGLEASIDLAHNYLGCEHLLLGLLDLPDSAAGSALGEHGVEQANARRAIITALAGYAHAKQTASASVAGKLDEILRRLDTVEARLESVGA